MSKRKKSKQTDSSFKYSVELTGIIVILIGIIGFGFGFIGSIIKKFAMFLAGNLWMLVLIGLIVTGIYMLYKRKMPKFMCQRLIGIYVLFIVALVALHFGILNNVDEPKEVFSVTYNNYMSKMSTIPDSSALTTNGDPNLIIGGGIIGATFSFLLYSLFAKTGTIIVLVVLTIFGIVLCFDLTLSDIVKKVFDKLSRLFKHKPKKQKLDNTSEVEYTEENTEYINPLENDSRKVIHSLDELKNNNAPVVDAIKPEIIEENPIEVYADGSIYSKPTISQIFDPVKAKKTLSSEFVKRNEQTLERVMSEFGVAAKVVDHHIGPAVTEYELTVPAGTKVSRVVNINKEIALALAAKDVIIQAPIPGKSTIGVEIPNPEISTVTLREVLESPQNQKSDAKICAALGKDIMGTAKVFDLSKTPHLLVAGSTGSGKSVCINGIIVSILMRYTPEELKLVLVDPKKVELTNYNGIPHLLCPVVSDPKKASLTLQKVVAEMDKRFTLFSEKSVKNIQGYNEWVEKQNKKGNEKLARMPYLVVIIDELADLMLVASKEVEDSIVRITQLARAAGIHLIVATQRPSTDVITGLVKNNIPSRIAFAVSSQIDSRTILDQGGAEKLLGRGDMLFWPMGASAPTRIQGCFVNDNEIERIISFWTRQGSAKYDEEFQNVSQNSSSGTGNSEVSSNDEEAYNDVVEFAIQTGKISASLIQRRFRFGYNRAARMIDLLESRGVVGPANGSKPREVLIKLEHDDETHQK